MEPSSFSFFLSLSCLQIILVPSTDFSLVLPIEPCIEVTAFQKAFCLLGLFTRAMSERNSCVCSSRKQPVREQLLLLGAVCQNHGGDIHLPSEASRRHRSARLPWWQPHGTTQRKTNESEGSSLESLVGDPGEADSWAEGPHRIPEESIHSCYSPQEGPAGHRRPEADASSHLKMFLGRWLGHWWPVEPQL